MQLFGIDTKFWALKIMHRKKTREIRLFDSVGKTKALIVLEAGSFPQMHIGTADGITKKKTRLPVDDRSAYVGFEERETFL